MFSGKAVGIVGLGRIGSAIAERAVAFGCMVSYHSRTERPGTNYKHYSNIVDLAANSKVLMLSCSLADQTRHIIIRDVIDALGPEGVLVNIGRGALVNEPELVSALIENRLVGAGLDVFEHEPGVPEELVGLDIMWSCCHTSGLTRGKLARHGRFGAWEKAHFQKKPAHSCSMMDWIRLQIAALCSSAAGKKLLILSQLSQTERKLISAPLWSRPTNHEYYSSFH